MTTTKNTTEQEDADDAIGIDIASAPECAPDILAAAPRLFTKGRDEYIELQCSTPPDPVEDPGVSDTFRVLERRDLYGAGITMTLVQQSASKAVYIFPTPEPQRKTDAERHLEDLMDDTDGLMAGIMRTIDHDALSPAARLLWDASGNHLSGKGSERCLSYVLGLDALIASPGIVQTALVALREELVTAVPELALVGSSGQQAGAGDGLVAQDHGAFVTAAVADPAVRRQLKFELMLELITRLGRVTGEMSKG